MGRVNMPFRTSVLSPPNDFPVRPTWRERWNALWIDENVGSREQWYRRAKGGRWSKMATDVRMFGNMPVYSWGWLRVPECPLVTHAEFPANVKTPDDVCQGVCRCEMYT